MVLVVKEISTGLRMDLAILWILALNLIIFTSAQQNAGSSVSPLLIKCYNDTRMLDTDNRLPATMETLIALIRKIEDNTAYSSNRDLSAQILMSFRQDGITRSNRGDLPSKYGIPYSPKEWNSYKNKVILKYVIPKVQELDTSMLTDLEQCSLHYLLSKSVDFKTRGDEQIVCNQLGKYIMRQKRHISAAEQVEQFGTESDKNSACPVELGVVNSKWGAISAGNLLSGIASGFNHQQIPVNGTGQLDSRFAATIVGDLAEAALYQITTTGGSTVEVGAEGNWNCTLEPKWYFVKKNKLLQVTDSEIRGGLDGLYIALSMNNIQKNFQDIKVSQILDLYYSSRGILSDSLRACNRKSMETTFVPTRKLIDQTSYFEIFLDPVATVDTSIDPRQFTGLAELAVNSFNQYIPNKLNDPGCSQINTTIIRIATDLVIFMDLSYEYKRIQPMISYLLENLDVNRFDTTYSIMNGKTSESLINSSTTLLDYHQVFNESVYRSMQQGMDFGLALETIQNLAILKLNNKTNSGGRSSTFLIITKNSPTDNQKEFAITKMEEIRRKYPDIRILILGPGAKADYKNYVINSDSDVFILSNTNYNNAIGSEADLITSLNEVIERERELPRTLINPNCGANFTFKDKSTINLIQYVEPSGKNLYILPSRYFFSNEDNAVLKVKGQGYGSIKVCTSRVLSIHVNNSQDCKTINSDEFSHDIKDYCGGSFSECEPVFISVSGESTYNRCNDRDCRFPDNIKFTISVENVLCHNSASKIMYSLLVSTLFLFILFDLF